MTIIADVATTDTTAVKELEQRWETAWNDHDPDAVAALCTEDLVYDEPALGETVHGREAIAAFVRKLSTAFPDYVFGLEGLYAEVSRRAAVVSWRMTGTHARSGRRVDFHGDDRLELDEAGLISHYRCLYDNDLVLRQVRGDDPES